MIFSKNISPVNRPKSLATTSITSVVLVVILMEIFNDVVPDWLEVDCEIAFKYAPERIFEILSSWTFFHDRRQIEMKYFF